MGGSSSAPAGGQPERTTTVWRGSTGSKPCDGPFWTRKLGAESPIKAWGRSLQGTVSKWKSSESVVPHWIGKCAPEAGLTGLGGAAGDGTGTVRALIRPQ